MLSIIQDYKSYLDLDLDRERFLLRDLDLLLRLRERDRPLLSSINLILRPFNSLPSSLSIAFFKSCIRRMWDLELDWYHVNYNEIFISCNDHRHIYTYSFACEFHNSFIFSRLMCIGIGNISCLAHVILQVLIPLNR